MVTFADRLRETDGRSSGFDYLRIGLALSVAAVHIPYLANGTDIHATILTSDMNSLAITLLSNAISPITAAILPMFFALSGFLVAGSLERCRTISAFVGLRMIRIFPALAVEILLSALIIGPMLTSEPLRNYFSDVRFRDYFLNMTGEIHFYLPGVFTDAPSDHAVNGQLWSIPYELLCYLCLTATAVVGVRKWRVIAPVATISVIALFAIRQGFRHGQDGSTYVPAGVLLVWCFLAGVCLYLYRERVPWSKPLFFISVAVSAISLSRIGFWTYLTPWSLTYVTAHLGLTNIDRAWFLRGADYSYGVYLYHWVLQQAVMDVAPRHWLINAAASMPLTVAIAAASWHLIEKPAMLLRKPLMATDRSGTGISLKISAAVAAALLIFTILYRVQSPI